MKTCHSKRFSYFLLIDIRTKFVTMPCCKMTLGDFLLNLFFPYVSYTVGVWSQSSIWNHWKHFISVFPLVWSEERWHQKELKWGNHIEQTEIDISLKTGSFLFIIQVLSDSIKRFSDEKQQEYLRLTECLYCNPLCKHNSNLFWCN